MSAGEQEQDLDIVELNLTVARTASLKARHLIEDNADKDDPTGDAATLRQVYALLLDVTGTVAGALAVIKQRKEIAAVLAEAVAPKLPHLRVVK